MQQEQLEQQPPLPQEPRRTVSLEDALKLESKFLTIVRGFFIQSFDPIDVVHEYYLKIVRVSDKDGKTYLERYDGSTTHATWLYGPLLNLCRSIKTRENSDAGRKLSSALRIDEVAKSEDQYSSKKYLFLDKHVSTNSSEEVEMELILNQLTEIAEAKFSKFSSTNSLGVPRSIYQIFLYLKTGMPKSEIAETLEVSKTFIDKQVKQFLSCAEVQTIYNELKEKVLVS